MSPRHQRHLAGCTSFFSYLKVENSGKSCKVKSFSSQKTVWSRTPFPYAGVMNFQLTSQQRLFIFKEEFSISEGAPTSKVFTTWGVHRDWELQVGLGASTACLVCRARSKTLLTDEETGRFWDYPVMQVFSAWAGVGPTPTYPHHPC